MKNILGTIAILSVRVVNARHRVPDGWQVGLPDCRRASRPHRNRPRLRHLVRSVVMKWFADFFGKKKVSASPVDQTWNDELFNLCWEREALYVEIDAAKRQKKKSSYLIAALAKNTARRLEIEASHAGR